MSGSLGASQALGHSGQFFASRAQPFLQSLENVAHAQKSLGRFRTLCFRSSSRSDSFRVLTPGLFHAQPRCFRFGVQTANFFASGGKLKFDSLQLCARLVEKMGCRNQGFFRFHVLRVRQSYRRLAGGDFVPELNELLLLLLRDSLQARCLSLMLPKFALQRQRSCFTCAPAGNDAPMVASAVQRQIIAMRIFMR